jgi:phospholipid/cholesterol/gamma-HCH transport system ATP-binding protein
MLFQSAALWSSMTVLENVCLPLSRQTALDGSSARPSAREVLEWVELGEFANFYPAPLSGGMKKRAGLARAIAAEPPLLFLDEPSAGLDPISSRRLDDLILDIRTAPAAPCVFVSHELPSLFAIADDGIFLDADSKRRSPTAARANSPGRTCTRRCMPFSIGRCRRRPRLPQPEATP